MNNKHIKVLSVTASARTKILNNNWFAKDLHLSFGRDYQDTIQRLGAAATRW